MKKAFLIMNLFVIICSLSAEKKITKISVKDFTYYNKKIGVGAILPKDWNVYTTKQNAHESIKHIFENKKGPNDSPLFIAMEKNQQSFVRCFVENPSGYDLNDYFKLLAKVIEGEKANITEAVMFEDSNTISCSYFIDRGGFTFIFKEYITRQNGYFLRISFGSLKSLLSSKIKFFDSITKNFYFKDDNAWKAKWLDINESGGKKIDYIQLYREEPEFTNKFGPDDKAVFHTVKGNKNTVYILGSIHMGHPDFYPMPENIEKAYNACKNIIFEVNTDKPENKEKIDNLTKLGTLEDNKTLDMIIPKYLYDRLSEELKKYGLNMETVKTYKPWLVSMLLSVLPGISLGYSEDFGVDRQFLNKAKSDNKNILELENIDDQIDLLINKLDQETNLGLSLLTMELDKVYYKELVRSWKKGDEAAMEKLIFTKSPLFKTEDFYEKFFYERNIKMAEKIKTYLNDETDYFVVVGAGHLIGDKSVIAILKAAGFTSD